MARLGRGQPFRPKYGIPPGAPKQIGRSAADTSVGAWTNESGGTTNLYQSIDETTASDSDYVQSEANPQASVYEASLASLTNPTNDTGHVVNVRALIDQVAGGAVSLVTELRNGAAAFGTPITWTDSLTATATTVAHALTTVEADQIASATAYGSLRLRWTATQAAGSAPSFVAASAFAATATNGATFAPAIPAGTNGQDILLLCLERDNNSAPTAPGGSWTALTAINGVNSSTTIQSTYWYWMVAAGTVGNATSTTATTITYGTSTVERGGRMFAIRGADTTTPFATVSGPSDAYGRTDNAHQALGAGSATTTASLTVLQDNVLGLVVATAYGQRATASITNDTGWSAADLLSTTLGNDATITFASKQFGTAGAIGAPTVTTSTTTTAGVSEGFLFAFQPIAGNSKARVTWADVEIPAYISSGGATGTAAVTLAGLSIAGVATETFAATSAVTLARFSVAAAGTYTPLAITGTAAVTLAPLSVAAVGVETFTIGGLADTFTRADSALTLGFAESGQVWVPGVLAWGISGNKAYPPGASGSGRGVAVVNAGIADAVVSAAVTTNVNGSSYAGLTLRYQDTSNYLYVVFKRGTTANVELHSVVATVDNILATGNGAVTYNVAANLQAVLSGTSIIVSVDGVQSINTTSSLFQTATSHGLAHLNTTTVSTWDNFVVAVSSGPTLARFSVASVGVETFASTGAVVLTPLSVAAVAAESWTATAAVTLARPNIAGVAVETLGATGAVTLAGLSVAGTAALGFANTGAVILAQPSVAATGTYTPLAITGTADVILAPLSGAAVATQTFVGTADVTLPGLSIAGLASSLLANAAVTLAQPTIAATGTYTPLAISGTAPVVLSGLSVSAAATYTPANVTGTAALILPALSITAFGAAGDVNVGQADITLAGLSIAAVAAESWTGTAGVVLTPISAAAVAVQTFAASAVVVLGKPVISSTASSTFEGTGAVTLPLLGVAAAGTYTPLAIAGTADVILPGLEIAGSATTGSGLFTLVGDVTLVPLDAAATAEQTFTGTADVVLVGVQPDALVAEEFTATTDVVLAGLSIDAVASSGADRTATAALTLAPLSIDAANAVLSFDATADIWLIPPFMGIAGPTVIPGPPHVLIAPTRTAHLSAGNHLTLSPRRGRTLIAPTRRKDTDA